MKRALSLSVVLSIIVSLLSVAAVTVSAESANNYTYVVYGSTAAITGYNGGKAKKSITIPDTLDGKTVTTIGADAFLGRDWLESISIPEGVTRIEDRAFADCSVLKTLNIPNSLTYAGENVLAGCTALKTCQVTDALAPAETGGSISFVDLLGYTVEQLATYTVLNGEATLTGVTDTTTVPTNGVIPSTLGGYPVTKIAAGAFANCPRINTLEIPECVKTIESGALSGCNKLVIKGYVGSAAEQYARDNHLLFWDKDPVSLLRFSAFSITVADNLQVNLKASAATVAKYENPYVTLTMEGRTDRTVTSFDTRDSMSVCRIADIVPYEIGSKITATWHGTYHGRLYTGTTVSASVADYCYSVLADPTADPKLTTLVVDLLNYGAESQKREGTVSGLVNEALTEPQKAMATADRTLNTVKNTAYVTVGAPQVSWKAAGLNLINGIQLRLKLSAANTEGLAIRISDGISASADVTELVPIPGESGSYYVFFADLCAYQMSRTVYITAYRGGVAVSDTLAYSIESYAHDAQSVTEGNLGNLVKAMMRYGDSARAYVESLN